jgi:hypothetical protein
VGHIFVLLIADQEQSRGNDVTVEEISSGGKKILASPPDQVLSLSGSLTLPEFCPKAPLIHCIRSFFTIMAMGDAYCYIIRRPHRKLSLFVMNPLHLIPPLTKVNRRLFHKRRIVSLKNTINLCFIP